MEFQILILIAFVIFLIGLIYLIQGPPYVASNDAFTQQVIKEIKRIRPRKILDMGSGEGKLVIALAEAGFQIDGVELNPKLVLRSRKLIEKKNLGKRANIFWRNFWNFDTSTYEVVTLYAIKHIMPRLETKLLKELHKGSYIISNYFVFPTLKPIRDDGRTKVYRI